MAEEILQKGDGVGMPKNTGLPFFAYGFFKSGELAYHSIEEHVDEDMTDSVTVNGFLYEKDGVPVFTRRYSTSGAHSYPVQGDLLFFKNGEKAKEAYNIIQKLEPKDLYKWGTINISENQKANVLFASKKLLNYEDNTLKGSIMLKRSLDRIDGRDKGASWHGYCDALFTKGMEFLQNKYFDNLFFSNINVPFIHSDQDFYALFDLQLAYIFLWTIIDRHNSLKYGLNLKLSSQRSLMVQDRLFKEVIGIIKDDLSFNYAEIFASDSGRSKSFTEAWEDKLETYYQIRCNVVHRGKGGHDSSDYPKLKGAFMDMFAIMQYMLKKELKKNFEEIAYTEEDALRCIERLKSVRKSDRGKKLTVK